MLNTSNSVVFKRGATTDLTKDMNRVEFDWEPIGGKVEEDEDFKLIENWSDYRIIINLEFYLEPTESLSLAKTWLPATNKVIRIDGVDIPVVLDMKGVNFSHVMKRNFKSLVKLKFKHKDPGALPTTPPP
ncbi:MAG: hypothetical protein H8E26_14105 [FCB group bacterium]|nr:hypothetical protein [FCB group bacterium]MBL7027417.1 hypothetical protein [Candidatus Neomarinimicrobiota bacterium]MBL7122601.1 hypothetical protein [Candidatus Neomarinimicrobiota bacterium]